MRLPLACLFAFVLLSFASDRPIFALPIVVSAGGQFINPDVQDRDEAVFNIRREGTRAVIDYGRGLNSNPNRIAFQPILIPEAIDLDPLDTESPEFVIGRLGIFNGQVARGTSLDGVTLLLNPAVFGAGLSSGVGGTGVSLDPLVRRISHDATINESDDPVGSRDRYTITGIPPVDVYEQGTFDVDIKAKLVRISREPTPAARTFAAQFEPDMGNSSELEFVTDFMLELTGLQNPQGDGFVEEVETNAVPEPYSVVIWLSLGTLVFWHRARRGN